MERVSSQSRRQPLHRALERRADDRLYRSQARKRRRTDRPATALRRTRQLSLQRHPDPRFIESPPVTQFVPAGAVIITFAGGLETPPMVTTTCCIPTGTVAGTMKLICRVPILPGPNPTNCVKAGTPPTVTDTGRIGLGS